MRPTARVPPEILPLWIPLIVITKSGAPFAEMHTADMIATSNAETSAKGKCPALLVVP